jgi:Necrosis inducing protein (NPP1)
MTHFRTAIVSAFALGLFAWGTTANAADYPALDQATPLSTNLNFNAITPLFDFDGDGCLPSAGISRFGEQNGGLNPSGSITGGCRRVDFLSYSNTLHRYACVVSNNIDYCGHFFSLYFLKDQATVFGGGHRHDWEHVAVWTQNGAITHAGYSAHGDLFNSPVSQLARENGHVKFVYHKDGVLTHAMRFASSTEAAENPYRRFVLPVITSWWTIKGVSVDNAGMRSRLNAFNYGSANIPLKDGNFLINLNKYRPPGYPSFTEADIENSR